MGWHAQLVMGPAGAGKSTYCEAVQKHCVANKRTVHVVNLDPAADAFNYECTADIKDLVTLEEVMEEEGLGPNGGLMFAMEYLCSNDGFEWLEEQLSGLEESYLLLDCPGQIELYTNGNVMRRLVDKLQGWGVQIAGVYLLDSQFTQDVPKFIAGALSAQSCMLQLEIPHVNVLTKLDLMDDGQKEELDHFLSMDMDSFTGGLHADPGLCENKYEGLNNAMGQLISEFSLVAFIPLNSTDIESLEFLMHSVDNCIQYGEDLEPKELREDGDELEEGYTDDV